MRSPNLAIGTALALALLASSAAVAAPVNNALAPGAAPAPSTSPSGSAPWVWSHVMETAAGGAPLQVDDTVMTGVPLGNGFVLAGNAGNGQRAVVWQSPDGRTWQRIEEGPSFEDSTISTLLAIPGGFLMIGAAVGSDSRCPGGEGTTCNPVSPIRMWTSADGIAWQSLPATSIATFGRAQLGSAASGAAGLVLFGWHVPVSAAALTTPMEWTSTDGLRWQAQRQFGQAYPNGVVESLTATADGFAAVGRNTGLGGPSSPGSAWYSIDGRTWQAAGAPGSTDEPTSVYAASDGLLATGIADATMNLWSSADGTSWSSVDNAVLPFGVTRRSPALLSDGARILAVGADSTGAPGTWASTDGSSWTVVPTVGPSPTLSELGATGVLGPNGALLVTTADNVAAGSFETTVWLGMAAEPGPSSSPSPETPPAGFDPTAPLSAFEISPEVDGLGGVWTAHVDGSEPYRWTTSERAFVEARLLDGVIWTEADPTTKRIVVHIGQIGAPPRLMTTRAWGLGSDTTGSAFYISLATSNGDDGLWRLPFDGSTPTRVLPPLPRAFERGLFPLEVAVSDDGKKLARRFAAGDIDMGGSNPVVQITDGSDSWRTAFSGMWDFTAEDQLVVFRPYGLGVYDLATRDLQPDPREWFEFPIASPDRRWTAALAADHVTITDRLGGTSRDVTIPELELRQWWLTDDALVLEEQLSDGSASYGTGIGRHLVMDLSTGWYRLFDPITLPVS